MTLHSRKDDGHGRGRRSRVIRAGLLLLAVLGSATPSLATDVCGPILSNTTWTIAGSPYVATCSVLVMSGITLTIEPGVIVRFNDDLALQVDGQLVARGSATSPITFTKHQTANWGYIWFTESSINAQFDTGGQYVSGSIIEHAIIEYAGSVPAESQSGALLIKNAFPFIHATTIKNNAASGINGWGFASAKTLRLTGNAFTGNTTSGNGGGINITVVSDADVVIADSTFIGNTTPLSGGGVNVTGGTLSLTNNTFTGNAAYYGGGIKLESTVATVSNNRVTGNTATWNGGGIFISYNTVTLNSNLISGNDGGDDGGGVFIFVGAVEMSNNMISRNVANNGGGVYVQDAPSVLWSSNMIMRNTSSVRGGGVVIAGSVTGDINHNSFVGNTAPTGSAAYLSGIGGLNFSSNLVFRNVATDDTGATLFLVSGFPTFSLNNIYENTCEYELWNDNPQGSGTVYAENNWWGTDASVEIMGKIYDYFDNAGKSLVDFSPFLTASNPAVPVPPIDKVGAFRPSDGTFYLDYNGSGTWEGCGVDRCLQIGVNGDIALVGDWNGSGSSKVGAFRPSDGTFYLDYNGNGSWDGCAVDRCLSIGQNGDTPLVGDWNGSGSSKVGAFRPSDGTFYLDYNGSGTWEGCAVDKCLAIGMAGDIPLVGDWNGSRTSKVGAFRPSDGTFYLDYNGNGIWEGCGTDRCLQIGLNGDVPLVGDWNDTGTSKVGAFRPSDGTFYLDYNGSGTWEGCGIDRCLAIGLNGDTPLVGDWNGSGTSKVGAFRPSDGTFYLDYNGSGTWEGCGTDRCLQIGLSEDTPLVGKW